MIFDSIGECEEDTRRELLNHIVLSGGNTLLNGLVERVENELNKLTFGVNIKY